MVSGVAQGSSHVCGVAVHFFAREIRCTAGAFCTEVQCLGVHLRLFWFNKGFGIAITPERVRNPSGREVSTPPHGARQVRQLCGELRGVRPRLREHKGATLLRASAQQATRQRCANRSALRARGRNHHMCGVIKSNNQSSLPKLLGLTFFISLLYRSNLVVYLLQPKDGL